MTRDETLVGGSIFSKIKSDPNVIPGLSVCLYCKVSQSGKHSDSGGWHKEIDYSIPLDCINGADIKQCPACKTIYILKDPTE